MDDTTLFVSSCISSRATSIDFLEPPLGLSSRLAPNQTAQAIRDVQLRAHSLEQEISLPLARLLVLVRTAS
jgi:hypothetical protein